MFNAIVHKLMPVLTSLTYVKEPNHSQQDSRNPLRRPCVSLGCLAHLSRHDQLK